MFLTLLYLVLSVDYEKVKEDSFCGHNAKQSYPIQILFSGSEEAHKTFWSTEEEDGHFCNLKFSSQILQKACVKTISVRRLSPPLLNLKVMHPSLCYSFSLVPFTSLYFKFSPFLLFQLWSFE